MSRDKIRHRQIFPSDFSVCVSNVKERVARRASEGSFQATARRSLDEYMGLQVATW